MGEAVQSANVTKSSVKINVPFIFLLKLSAEIQMRFNLLGLKLLALLFYGVVSVTEKVVKDCEGFVEVFRGSGRIQMGN